MKPALRRRGLFICLIGIDGAGKSTLAAAIAASLAARGIPCQVVYGRFRPIVTRPLVWLGRRLFLAGTDPFYDFSRYASKRRRLFRNSFIGNAYCFCLLVDHYLQALYGIDRKLRLGQNVIGDRYVHDTIVSDLAVDLGYDAARAVRLLARCLRLFPRPDAVFVIDVPEPVALARKVDIPSREYLARRRALYLALARLVGLPVLDGCLPVAELARAVEKRMLS